MVGQLDVRVPHDLARGALEAILGFVAAAISAKRAAIFLVNTSDDSLYLGPSSGPATSLGAETALARWTISHGDSLVLESRKQALKTFGPEIEEAGLLPLIATPIFSGGKSLGVLQMHVLAFAREEDVAQKLSILKLAADYMGCLLEKANLERELQEKEAFVMGLVRATIDAQEAERERICLEVHDGVAQTLASAFQYLQLLERTLPSREPSARQIISRIVGLVRQSIQEAREVINSLTPATLVDLGLVPTLRQELKHFERETGCPVEFAADLPRLAPDIEIALYRIIHEAITNVKKHACSPKVRIELNHLPDRLVAQVKDWGVGFDPAQQGQVPTRTSAGLFSMRKRAELLGGTFEVHSAPGQGTEIRVDVPIVE